MVFVLENRSIHEYRLFGMDIHHYISAWLFKYLLRKYNMVMEKKYSFCVYHKESDGSDWLLGDMSGMILQLEQRSTHVHPDHDIHYPKLLEHTRDSNAYFFVAELICFRVFEAFLKAFLFFLEGKCSLCSVHS